jgi:hypothetical protein
MRNYLRPALFLLAVAAPLLSPAGGFAQPPATFRDRDARAAFAFAASFARQKAAAHVHEDDGVRVWLSNGPTAYPGQPEPAPTYPVYQAPVYVEPFAPVMQRGVSFGGARCVTVGGRTT